MLNDILKKCLDRDYMKVMEADKKPRVRRSHKASYTVLPDKKKEDTIEV